MSKCDGEEARLGDEGGDEPDIEFGIDVREPGAGAGDVGTTSVAVAVGAWAAGIVVAVVVKDLFAGALDEMQ